MGGFYFENRDSSNESFIVGNAQLILTPAALQFMAATKPPLLPEIDEEIILDCSKADRATKLLALIQALYMVVQSISRAAKRLPISQLEINTIGHVFCALAIFILWFDKPKDVQIRTPITAPWARSLCAYMHMSDDGPGGELGKIFPILRPSVCKRRKSCQEECGQENLATFTSEKQLSLTKSGSADDAMSEACKHGLPLVRPPLQDRDKNSDASFWSSWQWINPRVDPNPYANIVMPVLWKNFRELEHYPQDDVALLRFNLALQYFRFWSHRAHAHFSTSNDVLSNAIYEKDQITIKGFDLPPCSPVRLFTDYATNWKRDDDKEMKGSMVQVESLVFIALLTACYGGLHILAWRAHFPTIIECYAWRVSALVIGISGFVLAIERAYTRWALPLHFRIKLRRYNWDHDAALANDKPMFYDRSFEMLQLAGVRMERAFQRLNPHASFPLEWDIPAQLAASCAILVVSTFFLARMYIVVEAFLSLRSMPVAMYESPNWTNWVPHI